LRKKIQLQVEKEAIRQVDDDANVLCVSSDNWHPGVIGIVASKLVEKFNKPSIVISENIDICKASCRSINNFDIGNLIIEAVENNIIETGGGHKMAGGFSVKKNKIDELKNFLKNKYNPKTFEYIKYYDYDLKLSSIDMNLFNEIQKISPFGIGNATPKFLIRDCVIKFPRIVGEKHLSCIVSDIYKNEFKSIAFNATENSINDCIGSNIGDMLNLIVAITKNTWLDQEKIELRIEDVITN
jgi:single-stranded-DNA-specific exonuclease